METNKMFEVAARGKYRFPFKGLVSTEDLWDLTVQQLDGIFKALKAQEKKAQEESLLKTRTPEDKELETKIEIVKYIVAVKLKEADQAKRSKEANAKKKKIMEILADKQDQELHSKTAEELQAMLDQIG